jgi:hypothetical protein
MKKGGSANFLLRQLANLPLDKYQNYNMEISKVKDYAAGHPRYTIAYFEDMAAHYKEQLAIAKKIVKELKSGKTGTSLVEKYRVPINEIVALRRENFSERTHASQKFTDVQVEAIKQQIREGVADKDICVTWGCNKSYPWRLRKKMEAAERAAELPGAE